MNYNIRLDLLKLNGACLQNIKGNTATKRCLIIPIDENDSIFLGEKGCHLSLIAFQLQTPKYEDTHCIKPSIPKNKRETMTPQQKEAIPIIGGLHQAPDNPNALPMQGTLTADSFDSGELPF